MPLENIFEAFVMGVAEGLLAETNPGDVPYSLKWTQR